MLYVCIYNCNYAVLLICKHSEALDGITEQHCTTTTCIYMYVRTMRTYMRARTYMRHCRREVGRIPVLWLQRVPTGGIWRARVETQLSLQSWVSLQAPRVLRLRLSLSLSSSWTTSPHAQQQSLAPYGSRMSLFAHAGLLELLICHVNNR